MSVINISVQSPPQQGTSANWPAIPSQGFKHKPTLPASKQAQAGCIQSPFPALRCPA